MELDLAIQNYFAECDPHTTKALVETGRDAQGNLLFDTRTVLTEQKPYLASGLARALGIDRDTLVNYKKCDKFSARCRQASSSGYGYGLPGHHLLITLGGTGYTDLGEPAGPEMD